MTLLAGSASWTDPTLLTPGLFYPLDVHTAEQRLRFYASRFPMVEVDSTFYGLPHAGNAQLWAERTPPGFVFDIKAFRAFTGHDVPLSALPRELRSQVGTRDTVHWRDMPAEVRQELWWRMRTALHPLQAAGKLGAVLFQFAPSVRPGAEVETHLEHCVDMMAGATVAFEFRHRSWFEGPQARRTLAMLRQLEVVNVVVDAPQGDFSNSVPAVWEATHPELAIVRLHGRNVSAWNSASGASSGRFNYVYNDTELRAMLPAIRRLEEQSGQVHATFNTNYRDQGQANARKLLTLWYGAGTTAPADPFDLSDLH
ncbi:DUF72 domain-containing protein [Xylophilus sp. GOD-11R]|uniref:DUF72 domain-containing protein n=1 Tax=Xylophilus sp. GOD-11R TaxID=3089814 RepID=UPI00298C979B|nr:DUF72 domain-containing protein [Xylophilus sp. GOD-11R]WPB56132.1 DUF72 domain-containing protein [Xylophilus sp. GOD-11R]